MTPKEVIASEIKDIFKVRGDRAANRIIDTLGVKGYVVVHKFPTREMLNVAIAYYASKDDTALKLWQAMIGESQRG